jgi:hypothetical protein
MAPTKDVVVEMDPPAGGPTQLPKQVRLRVMQLSAGEMKGIFALHAIGSVASIALTVATVVFLYKRASNPTPPPPHLVSGCMTP